MRRFLREPIVLFLLLGTLIFVLDRVAHDASALSGTITIEDAFVRGLVSEHQGRVGHVPSEREKEALVARYVEDEVLVREAFRLGLDRGDTIVRRRLAQKMEFYLRSELDVPEPTDAEVAAYVRAHPEQYTEPGRYAFTHLFFARDARGTRARADADAAHAAVLRGETPASDAFALGPANALMSEQDLAARYGATFASQLATCELTKPCGPLESAFGYHVVTLTRTEPGAPTPVARARARAVPDIVRERENAAYRRALRELVRTYDVERTR